ncbi:MAG: Calx-beta domain-containing protein [Caldilineaceae bacterium]
MIYHFFTGHTRLRPAFWLVAISVLLWAHPAWAATRTVDTLTDDANLTACTQAANDCSLRGALSGADANDTINFDPNLANQTVTLSLGQLAISQPITLDGSTAPTVTVNGDNLSRVITSTQPLTITHLIIENGRVTNGNGGGLYVGSDLRLISSVIRNSTTIGDGTRLNGHGGGVYVAGDATLTDATILNNYSDFYGGGAFVGGDMVLTGTTIFSNTTGGANGGGIYLIGNATIMDSTVHNNKGAKGGGMFVGSAATITGATFHDNSGYEGGGAYVQDDATLTGASFLNNTAFTGGGVYVSGTVSITDTNFLSNAASSDRGGGAYVGGNATLTHISFLANTASREGGGAHVGGNVTIVDVTVLSNTAQSDGGGLWMGGNATILNTTFRNNMGMVGGGAYVSGTVTITATTFLSNLTSFNGAGVYVDGSASIVGTTFLSNTAMVFSGGGLNVDGDATILDTTFRNNMALARGGGGAAVDGNAIISNTTFLSNTAKLWGGGLEVGGNATILGATFLSNTVGAWGGGAWIGKGATITDTSWISNTAQQSGGALYLYSGSNTPMLVVNNLFARNRSFYNEGDALYLFGSKPDSRLTLLHNTLANPAVEDGTAIYVRAGTLAITNTLIANHATAIEQVGGTVSEDYTLFDNVTMPYSGTISSGGHSITGTAAFADPAQDDYHLTAASAALNAGTDVGISTDFDGDARPQYALPDIGYDEAAALAARIAISDASGNEGNSGSSTILFNVTLDMTSATPITVKYTTSDGSATAGSDYSSSSGTLTFAPGVTSQTISVTVNGDTQVENDETFSVSLSAPTNAIIQDGQATGTILNDDVENSTNQIYLPAIMR